MIICADILRKKCIATSYITISIAGFGFALAIVSAMINLIYFNYVVVISILLAAAYMLRNEHKALNEIPCDLGHSILSGHHLKHRFRKGDLEIYCETCGVWYDTDCRVLTMGGLPTKKVK